MSRRALSLVLKVAVNAAIFIAIGRWFFAKA